VAEVAKEDEENWIIGEASLSFDALNSVAKGPKFRPHNSKGAAKKAEGP
jgi:hypothetical protein